MKNLWYKITIMIGKYLHDVGLKISLFGSSMCKNVPSKYKTYNPEDPTYPVGPPIMDEAVVEQFDELLSGRKDMAVFSSKITDDPCEIPPIRRGGCEVQTGTFRRIGCVDGDK